MDPTVCPMTTTTTTTTTTIVGIKQLRPIKKNIGPALETRQSHTIEYRVSKIVPAREPLRGE